MLKENDNKKDELNEVFSIKGEDLKIEDTILGGLKDDCLGLIVRDIHFHMSKIINQPLKLYIMRIKT